MANETKKTRYPWADAPEWATHAVVKKDEDGYWGGLVFTNIGWVHRWEKIHGKFDRRYPQNSLEWNPNLFIQAPQLSPDFTEWNTQMLGEVNAMVAEQVQARVNDALYREHLRAQFAGQALQGMLSDGAITGDPAKLVDVAAAYADTLIAALYPSPKAEDEK